MWNGSEWLPSGDGFGSMASCLALMTGGIYTREELCYRVDIEETGS
ncbi:MAG: hypothetical protein GX089_00845 [Fibrobacter sp.]|nr:hypothetical protein [Fibrobacter sp.]